MKFLVTGAAGFVGTNVTRELLRLGHEVIAVDALSRKGSDLNHQMLRADHPSLVFHRRELEDVAPLIYRERPTIVFHFAAQVAVTSSLENPTRDFRINAESSFVIAKAAQDIGVPVIYTSTNKVYGDNVNHLPLVEQATRYDFTGEFASRGLPESFSIDANHHTPYGVSKLVGELYVREFGGIANRCSCMYGPNQFGIVDQGWLSHIATNKLLGRPSVVYGDGKQVRDAIHIRDVVALLLRQAEALAGPRRAEIAGEVYNVGGGFPRTISLLELFERWQIKPTFDAWRPADQKVFYCDIGKAEKTFGWRPAVGLDEGLEDLFEWTRRSLAR
jgi:CDP-paratose 2-epimerase